ncbi:MAG TPA: hypothetical protein DEE98_02870 [Elusimicrobia bacterium]|nr:MAG: hypothetical protein A2278_07700 [Elusimicrobia bacterium RIFOXYA12_FULL_49_49]OGS07843.1 MAG: hypothetical protein A2204_06090 [Elusimicrobia bacterium RIFOXYA1_FULL_47_7]OGS09400.1 MAG: hypothetical protein A2386_07930 [Elusimicrobia bacterium RIFOXYB1_FULL_48_9]OGS16052.1 MAG: hypothetical protein A2251_02565 [Elusimicrobia bacterium RIFOXYA2_FULL_47_53]OGS25777.1 MAG: hypothetical protein A2339_05070 [Elusimicrobia bacterium RIFOXYB12_FULL_50_12]OGS30196.1 MAG: hypothetical protein
MLNNTCLKIVVLLVSLLITPELFAAADIDSALTYYLSGNIDKALRVWNSSLAENPSDSNLRSLITDSLIILGKEALASGKFKKACEYLMEAYKISPVYPGLKQLVLDAELENIFHGQKTSFSTEQVDSTSEKWEIFNILLLGKSAVDIKRAQDKNIIIHTVEYGDTIEEIAAKYFNDRRYCAKIWRDNPQLLNPHRLFPGDKLKIYLDSNLAPAPQLDIFMKEK